MSKIPWNKGKGKANETQTCKVCGKPFVKKDPCNTCSPECRKAYTSNKLKGHRLNTGKTLLKKGNIPWNKGIKNPNMSGENHPRWKGCGLKNCLHCGKEIKLPMWRMKDESRGKFCSRICKGKYHIGELAHHWMGGIYDTNQKIRSSREHRLWREAVLERDNYTCIWCGSKKRVEADHIKPFRIFPELRFAIDNGRTLCHECHRTTSTYGNVKVRREDYE